ncbi:MAG: AI-2E family transporter [Rhodococcus sp. (in: high G+C Gram-positive bacteria)]
MHPLVRIGAEWTWWLLVLFAGFLTFCYVVARLDTVVIPLGLALLASAMLVPLVDWMQRRGVPRAAAVVIVIITSIGVVAGIVTFVVEQFIEGLPQLGDQFTASINDIEQWLADGPFHISQDQIRQASESLVTVSQDNQVAMTSGALTTARRRIRVAGSQGFGSLVGYVRATVAVAAADAIGIGAGLAVLGVPLALPLASLVFIGAFVPIIGAFLTGFVAVFIALVTKGLLTALIALGIVVAVMQLEAHVLQPLLLGRAVRLHPLAVVLAITVGVLLAGIVGGLLAVPIVAVLNTAIRCLLADDPDEVFEELEEHDPEASRFPAAPGNPHPDNRALEPGTLREPEALNKPGPDD